jgi:hypothetical protein
MNNGTEYEYVNYPCENITETYSDAKLYDGHWVNFWNIQQIACADVLIEASQRENTNTYVEECFALCGANMYPIV